MDPITSDDKDHPTQTVNNILCTRAKANGGDLHQNSKQTKQLRQSIQSSSWPIGKPGEPPISPINSMHGRKIEKLCSQKAHHHLRSMDPWCYEWGHSWLYCKSTLNFLYQTSKNLIHWRLGLLTSRSCFLERGIIEKATHSNGEYICNIFIRPRKDGSYRLTLNL